MEANAAVTLADLGAAETGTILEITGDASQRQRLSEMGMTPGCPVRVICSAPLGDPFVVELRNFRFAMRRGASRNVIVSRVQPA